MVNKITNPPTQKDLVDKTNEIIDALGTTAGANIDLTNLSNGLANTICITPATTTSTASSATPAVVVENYINGASWYRIYSDGWCEQGGKIISTGAIEYPVSLLKAYVNNNYCAVIASGSPTSGESTVASLNARTVSAFTIAMWGYMWGYPSFNTYVYWKTGGYIN